MQGNIPALLSKGESHFLTKPLRSSSDQYGFCQAEISDLDVFNRSSGIFPSLERSQINHIDITHIEQSRTG